MISNIACRFFETLYYVEKYQQIKVVFTKTLSWLKKCGMCLPNIE